MSRTKTSKTKPAPVASVPTGSDVTERIWRSPGNSCGFCITKVHDDCVVETVWFNRSWVCGCANDACRARIKDKLGEPGADTPAEAEDDETETDA
jgi:hypothetical protein